MNSRSSHYGSNPVSFDQTSKKYKNSECKNVNQCIKVSFDKSWFPSILCIHFFLFECSLFQLLSSSPNARATISPNHCYENLRRKNVKINWNNFQRFTNISRKTDEPCGVYFPWASSGLLSLHEVAHKNDILLDNRDVRQRGAIKIGLECKLFVYRNTV